MQLKLPDFLIDNGSQIEFVGTRLTLADVMHLYNRGYSAEMIALEYPSLPLSVIHHFIAFVLENDRAVQDLVKVQESSEEAQRAAAPNHVTLQDLRRRLAAKTHARSA